MAYREVPRMEIQESSADGRWGHSQRQIAAGTGLSRDTVRKYLAAAQGEGIARDGPAPDEEQLTRLARVSQSGPRRSGTPGQDLLEPWADQIYRWLTGDCLQVTRIHELLAGHGCRVSYPSLRRFILERNWRKLGTTTVRMEDALPGEVAEAAFGRLGLTASSDGQFFPAARQGRSDEPRQRPLWQRTGPQGLYPCLGPVRTLRNANNPSHGPGHGQRSALYSRRFADDPGRAAHPRAMRRPRRFHRPCLRRHIPARLSVHPAHPGSAVETAACLRAQTRSDLPLTRVDPHTPPRAARRRNDMYTD